MPNHRQPAASNGLWADYRLGDVMALVERRTPVAAARTYPMAGVYSFGRGLFERAALTSEGTAYAHLNQLQENDFVVSRLKAWEGAVAVVPPNLSGRFLSPEFPTYSLNPEIVLPSYWSIVCSRPWLWSLLATTSRGMGGRRERVHKVGILDLRMALPPLNQQHRIVNLIESVDSYIDSLQTQVEATRAARSALLSELLSNSSSDWRKTTIGDAAEVNPKEPPLPEDAPFVPMDAVNAGQRWVEYTEPRGKRSGARARAGDVLFARITPCLENGKTAQVQPDIELCGGSTEFIVLRGSDRVDPDFLYFWATERSVRKAAANLMTGSTGRQRLSAKDLAAMALDLPPISEQRRIVDLLGTFDHQSAALESQIAATGIFRRGVLSELLSGERLLDESYDAAVSL